MLRPEILAVLKQSVPVLEEKGVQITTTFYGILFERNPELKNLFNMANQRNGNQARAWPMLFLPTLIWQKILSN